MIMWRRLVLFKAAALLVSVIGLAPIGAAAASDLTIRGYDGAVLSAVISSQDSLAWVSVRPQGPVPLGVRETERVGGIERLAAEDGYVNLATKARTNQILKREVSTTALLMRLWPRFVVGRGVLGRRRTRRRRASRSTA